MKDTKREFAKWLETSYLNWQLDTERNTIIEFANYLDIPRPLLSHYMNARYKPEGENIEKIAAKLGPKIYDILGLQRPDPMFEEIRQVLDAISETEKDEMINMIREWAADHNYKVVAEQLPESDQENGS